MKKSITTRVKITKNKKGVTRTMAQCHFRAKKTGSQIRLKKRKITNSAFTNKIIKRPGSL